MSKQFLEQFDIDANVDNEHSEKNEREIVQWQNMVELTLIELSQYDNISQNNQRIYNQ